MTAAAKVADSKKMFGFRRLRNDLLGPFVSQFEEFATTSAILP
jgi:hypothetical protein